MKLPVQSTNLRHCTSAKSMQFQNILPSQLVSSLTIKNSTLIPRALHRDTICVPILYPDPVTGGLSKFFVLACFTTLPLVP